MTKTLVNLFSDRELVTSRVLNARREQVFRLFSTPAHLAHWWGPKGFTNTFHEFDFRPGGTWRFIMHGPDGIDFQNESTFVEVVPPERIVIKHINNPKFELTISLKEENGKTRIGWQQVFNTAEERERIAKYAVDANEQNLDRLEKELATFI
jgi:uncharacterized protein YndB with AHSA1/START domain